MTLLKWIDDGRWEIRLERDGERLLLGESSLEPVAGAVYAGVEVTMQGLIGATELNDKTGVVGRWIESKDRWEVRIGSRRIQAKASNLQLRPSRLWAPMTMHALRTCTDPPPQVPCTELIKHNASLPRNFIAYNEDGRTIYVRFTTGQRSLYPPTAADGRPRGCAPQIPSGFRDPSGGFPCCGDVHCNACATKVWFKAWRDGVPKPYNGPRSLANDIYFSGINFYCYPNNWRARVGY